MSVKEITNKILSEGLYTPLAHYVLYMYMYIPVNIRNTEIGYPVHQGRNALCLA